MSDIPGTGHRITHGIIAAFLAASVALIAPPGSAAASGAGSEPTTATGSEALHRKRAGASRIEATALAEDSLPRPTRSDGPPLQPAWSPASISGWVTDESGAPVADATVWAYSRSDDDWVAEFTTLQDGSYLIDELDPGIYTVEFDAPNDSDLAGEWWHDRSSRSNATFFRLHSGEDLRDVDAVLTTGGTVSGRVTDEDSNPVPEATVYAADSHWKYATTNADGTYTIRGVAPGPTLVEFDGPDSGSLATEWWNNRPNSAKADRFTVVADREVTDRDAVLSEGGFIEGTVYDYFWEEPASEITVYVLTYDHGWRYVTEAETDEDGGFSVSGLWAGASYAVIADDSYVSIDATADAVGITLPTWKGKVHGSINPRLTGSPEVGATLKVDPGSGLGGMRLRYAWLRDEDESDSSKSSSYRLSEDDLHAMVAVQVTGAWHDDTWTVSSRPTPWIARAGKPTIEGTVKVGGEVFVDPGDWTEGTTFDCQWYLDGKPVSGNGLDLTIPSSAAGKRLSAKLTGSLDEHATLSRNVRAGRVLRATEPVLTGAQAVGFTVGVDRGSWSSHTSFSYRWLRDGEPIPGAIRSTYRLTTDDADHEVTVRVTGKRSGYATVVEESAARGAVTSAAVPLLDGLAATGHSLRVRAGSWGAGTDLGYQWYVDGTPIEGAIGDTFDVDDGIEGRHLTVTVTGRRDGYADVALPSAPTSRVLRWTEPIVTGTPAVGLTLGVDLGSWTARTTFSYRWLRDGTAIDKATRSTYAATAADAGHTLSVMVTGRRSGYTTISSTSASRPLP